MSYFIHSGGVTSKEAVERFDFKNTNWSEWEISCTEAAEDWLHDRNRKDSIDEDYQSFVSLLHEKAKEIIPKKQICKHSKRCWILKLTERLKTYRKAKRQFS